MKKITSDDRMVKVWRPHYQESTEVINIDTIGKKKKAIEEYIRNQLTVDEMMDQMMIKEYSTK